MSARIATFALALRAAIPVLLWTQPLDRVLRALSVVAPRRDADPQLLATLLATVERVTDAVTRGARPLRTACLVRALLRYALLQRLGIAASFVIGVRSCSSSGDGQDGFEAHAFVTLDGVPIMERSPAPYRTTFEWPRSALSGSAAPATHASFPTRASLSHAS